MPRLPEALPPPVTSRSAGVDDETRGLVNGGGDDLAVSSARGRLDAADVTCTRDVIGKGGSGVVYKGSLRLPDGSVVDAAIKLLHEGSTEREQDRFVTEFGIALRASQRCTRACRMYGCVRLKGALSLVMQLYPRSLHEFIDARKSPNGRNYIRPLEHAEVLYFTQQILEGLAQLHAERIVVRDLKPANILMDEHDQLVISDFGLAATLTARH